MNKDETNKYHIIRKDLHISIYLNNAGSFNYVASTIKLTIPSIGNIYTYGFK